MPVSENLEQPEIIPPRRKGRRTVNPKSLANLVLFKKGHPNANPGGRTDAYLAAQRLCREASPQAAQTMVRLMSDPDPRIQLMAADKVYERAWGRAPDYDPKRDAEKPKPVFDPHAYSPKELEVLEVALKLLMENRQVVK